MYICYTIHVHVPLLHNTCTCTSVTQYMYMYLCYTIHVHVSLLHNTCTCTSVTQYMYIVITITNIHTGGDYLIPLQGHCLTPRPQGPFNIKTGGSITIPFRNVFHQSRQFSFSVDNPLFIVKQGDTLKPRKLYNIIVQFDKGSVEHSNKSKQSDAPVKLAKLVVTCVQSASHHNRGDEGIQWTYYLRGLPP